MSVGRRVSIVIVADTVALVLGTYPTSRNRSIAQCATSFEYLCVYSCVSYDMVMLWQYTYVEDFSQSDVRSVGLTG